MKALRSEPVERTPVWLMRQAGRYQPEYRAIRDKLSFLELCHNSQLAAEVTVMAVDMLGVDAGIIFADILLPLESLNCGLHFAKGDGPVIDRAVTCAGDVEALKLFDIEEKLGFVLEAIKLFISERPAVPIIGFAGAPLHWPPILLKAVPPSNLRKPRLLCIKKVLLSAA